MTSYTNIKTRTRGILAGFFLLSLPNLLPAQDTLFLVNGEMLRCRVKTINRVDVDYIPWGQSGPLYSINKGLLLKLVYETGSNVVFQESPAPVSGLAVAAADSTAAALGSEALIQKAMNDAQQNYDYTRPRNASVAIGLTAPVFYLIPGVIATAAMASTAPRYDYLNVPNEALYRSSPDYRQAYTRQAKKIKSRKVWGGFLTGAGTTVAGIIALGILLL